MIHPHGKQGPGGVAAHYDTRDQFYREIWGEHVQLRRQGDPAPRSFTPSPSLEADLAQRSRLHGEATGAERPVIDHEQNEGGRHSGGKDEYAGRGGHTAVYMHHGKRRQDQSIQDEYDQPLGRGDDRTT
jgi:hypothetical protein